MKQKDEINTVMNILKNHFHSDRKTTLNRMREEKNPFKILIGCIVSINIKDEVTESILGELFSRVHNFEDIVGLDNEILEKILYRARCRRVKAKTLKSISREILERFDGTVSSVREELISIKGIGPKTANVVLNFAFDLPYIPIDSNTLRIVNRIGWIKTTKNHDVEKLLVENLDDNLLKEANALFMLQGKNICVPVSPFCSRCPINEKCGKVGLKKSR